MKKRTIALCLILVLIPVLTGCIRYDITMKVNTNKTVDIRALLATYVDESAEADDDSGLLSQEEIDDMAEHGPETGRVVGRDYIAPAAPGLQTLDGVQAVSYCRVRHVAGGDFKRSERQRIVLSQMFSKLKAAGPIKLAQIAQDVFPNVYTSMNLSDILALVPGISSYTIASSEGFPFENSVGRLGTASVVYADPNLYQSVILLHEKLFGTEDYTPSSRVGNYSIEIGKRR